MTGKSLKSILKKILINPFDIPGFVYIILAFLSPFICGAIGLSEITAGLIFLFLFFMAFVVFELEKEREEEKWKNAWPDLSDYPSSYRGGAAWLEDLISIILGIVFFIGGIAFLVFLVKFFWNSF